jgi:threonyl-tRNA synthetase
VLIVTRRVVKETDWAPLDKKAAQIFKEKQSFDRLEVSKENLKRMFAYSKYKLHYINHLVEGEKSTVYRCGTLVDLCRGPHIQNTGKIKTFKIMQVSMSSPKLVWGTDPVNRTRRRTSSVTRRMTPCNVSEVSPSPIRSRCKNT